MKLRSLFLLFMLSLSLCSMAQSQPDDVVTYDNDIESILINPFTGSVIVKDRDAISSYNPDSKELEWKITDKEVSSGNALNKANEIVTSVQDADVVSLLSHKKDIVEFIPNSPFIMLFIDGKTVVINSLSGKVVYNSGNYGNQILTANFLLNDNALLLMVIDKKSYSCIFYDLDTDTEKWVVELSPLDSFMSSLKSLVKFKVENVAEDIALSTDKDIYATINSVLYKLDKQTGKISWKTDYQISQFAINRKQTHIITIRRAGNVLRSRTVLNLLDASNGEKVWKDDLSTKYISYLEDNGDKILVAHASGLNFYNYADGKKVWKKDATGNKIKQVIAIGNDYLYVADKDMNLIDKDGKNKWKKTIQICDKDDDEVLHLNLIDNNRVFYLSDAYGNMVDYNTGKKVWKKDVNFDRNKPLLYDFEPDRNVYIAYNDKKVYIFDPNGRDEKKNEPFAKLKGLSEDKTVEQLDLMDWGIVLTGQSDLIGVDFDGETRFHNKYKEPGGGQRKTMNTTANIAKGILGTKSAIKKSLSEATVVVRDENGKIVDQGYLFTEESRNAMKRSAEKADAISAAIMNNVTKNMKNRFNALKHAGDYAYVLNKAEEGGAELVKVRKTDGKEIERVKVDSNKPIYEVDDITHNLYYANGKELKVFTKK